jgi:pimeloyl-ACP methyl ester carboxylesterase
MDPQFVVSHDGERIAYYTAGSKSSPAVILLHGFTSSSLHNWSPRVLDLLSASFFVVAMDLRGHGKSAKPVERTSYANNAEGGASVSSRNFSADGWKEGRKKE